jgi:hypothetical protein
MRALLYRFTMSSRKGRSVHQIIAHCPVEAICTGIRISPEILGPVRIVCKPIRRVGS